MRSLLRSVKKRKKSRRLGEVEVVKREEYGELELDAKVEMIRTLVPLGLMHVHDSYLDELHHARLARSLVRRLERMGYEVQIDKAA